MKRNQKAVFPEIWLYMEKEKTNVDYSREMAIKDNYLERDFKRKILYDTDD